MTAPYHNKALPPGTILREWRLEQVLGVGGFGIVYRARGIYFDELVAIKEYFPSSISDRRDGDTVVPSDSSSEEVHALGLKKFVEEAKLLWNLSKPTRHPNIVSVRSLFEIHGTAYMVMDFESGVSLSQLLREGRKFDQDSLLTLIRPIAEGLERAHRVGVLHRDIKPANILVSEEGRPVLIDFGSARFDAGDATSTKVTFHTPPYAAIEQYVKTYEQGPWTDIYALGVVLYECVTGKKPPEVLERLHGGLGETLASRDWPGFGRTFLRAVDAAMIVRPDERPQTISKWLDLFEAPDGEESVPPMAAEIDDAPTRFTVLQDMVEPSLNQLDGETPPSVLIAKPGDPPRPIATPEPAAAIEPTPAPVPLKRVSKPIWRSARVLIAGTIVALLFVSLILFRQSAIKIAPALAPVIPAQTSSAQQQEQLQLQPSPSPSEAVPEAGNLSGLLNQSMALLADARRSGRPRAEIGRIKAYVDQVQTMATQDPKLAAATPPAADLAKSAALLGASITAGLQRDAHNRLHVLGADLPWADPDSGAQPMTPDDAASAATLRDARLALDSAIGSVATAGEPTATVGAIRRSLSAFQRLGLTIAKTGSQIVPAKRQTFATIEAAAKQAGNQVIQLASAPKPGLFASKARRDSWQAAQSNAGKARELLATLDQLSRSAAAAPTASELDQEIDRARALNAQLHALGAPQAAAPQDAQAQGQ